jgi:hypothetical protein
MRQAITTKFIGPTDTKGSRVKATSASGHSILLAWKYEEGVEGNHKLAAMALASKLGWNGRWFVGGMADRFGGNVYVQDDGDSFDVQGA